MELIKLKLLDTDGMTLLTAPAAGQVSLVYMNAYKRWRCGPQRQPRR